MGSPILRFASRFHGSRRMMSSSNPSSPSPWLMLPPSRGGIMAYKFYSLADDEVILLTKHPGGPDDDARVVGSSHGWLALMNRRNNDLFLSNPLSRRHIKLPPLDALPEPEINRHGTVSKLILSASPDDEEKCRALMSFGPLQRLAICRPGQSEEWAPVGGLFVEPDGNPLIKFARAYADIVYSTAQNRFSCLALSHKHDFILEEWDPQIPKLKWIQKEALPAVEENRALLNRIPAIEGRYKWLDDEKAQQLRRCRRITKHLACVEATDEVYVLFRYVGTDKTVAFIAARVEKEEEESGKIRLVGSCLEGLAVFVGTNNSFALSVQDFPHLKLKPNSIYFTPLGEDARDVGIFDCVNGTFSSPSTFPFPTLAPHIWFTPTLP